MELKHLKSFHAVAELLHFRRAAQRVGVTQPALSQHVSKLEKALGVQLLERDRRTVQLTPAGQTLRDETRGPLELLERARTSARLVGGMRDKTLKVGQLQYNSHAFLPGGLQALKTARPDVLVELLEVPPHEVVAAVRDRWVDVGFAFGPISRADDLVMREVMRGRWVVWVPENHPLAALEVVPVERLAQEPLLVFDRAINSFTYDFLMRLFTVKGRPARVAHHLQQPHHGLPLVLQGLGCFVVGSYVIQDAPKGAVCRPLSGFANDIRVTAVWRPDGRTALIKPFLSGL